MMSLQMAVIKTMAVSALWLKCRMYNLKEKKHQPEVLHHSGQHPSQLVHGRVLVPVERERT